MGAGGIWRVMSIGTGYGHRATSSHSLSDTGTLNMTYLASLLLAAWAILASCTHSPGPGCEAAIVTTWRFSNASLAGWRVLRQRGSALDAVESACAQCQSAQCDHTVGWGGSPDENGETTLDAMIMDGPSHRVGAVAALRGVKNAIGVARAVLEHTEHTLLVGEQASQFAVQMGFSRQNLSSPFSERQFAEWRHGSCQPNYWTDVTPDPRHSCGPYKPNQGLGDRFPGRPEVNEHNHDTIGVVALDHAGRLASGTSTNGMNHKIPGRVGDSPIAGAGSYVDQEVGGAAATGDGDVILRFLTSYQAVENLRRGMSPAESAREALRRVQAKFPEAQVGLVVLDAQGKSGAACIGVEGGFPYTLASDTVAPTVLTVDCIKQ